MSEPFLPPVAAPDSEVILETPAPGGVVVEEVVAEEVEVADGEEKEPVKRGGGILGILKEFAIILVCGLVVSWLIKTFLVQAFFIPSESMENTLEVGDRVMVNRLVPRFFEIHRGDIVVFRDPGGWLAEYRPPERSGVGNAVMTALTLVGLVPHDSGDHLVKRTIGVAGDHVICCDYEGRVSVNGEALNESLYIRRGTIPSQSEFDVIVPPGTLFVMGDNRQNSADSRYNTDRPFEGFVPVSNVVGTAFVTVWPLNHARLLRYPSSGFNHVP